MPDVIASLREELATANRILAMEGIIDAFGHISVRHPTNPDRYFITKYQAAELVQPQDIVELTLDSVPVGDKSVRLFSEVPIHGCIFQDRPDVMSVCHHHADAVMPFCIATGIDLKPVFHIGASTGETVPVWDSRDEFGDTKLVVTTAEEAHSLARTLGDHAMVLMRHHGATIAAGSLREAVFRTVYSVKNAELFWRARMLGTPDPLTAGETQKAGGHVMGERSMGRAWDYWTYRLARFEAMSPPPGRAARHAAAQAASASRRVKATVKKARKAVKAKTKSRGERR